MQHLAEHLQRDVALPRGEVLHLLHPGDGLQVRAEHLRHQREQARLLHLQLRLQLEVALAHEVAPPARQLRARPSRVDEPRGNHSKARARHVHGSLDEHMTQELFLLLVVGLQRGRVQQIPRLGIRARPIILHRDVDPRLRRVLQRAHPDPRRRQRLALALPIDHLQLHDDRHGHHHVVAQRQDAGAGTGGTRPPGRRPTPSSPGRTPP